MSKNTMLQNDSQLVLYNTYGVNTIINSLSISALAAIFAVVDHHVYIRVVVVKHYAWLLSSLDSPGDDFLSNVG